MAWMSHPLKIIRSLGLWFWVLALQATGTLVSLAGETTLGAVAEAGAGREGGG